MSEKPRSMQDVFAVLRPDMSVDQVAVTPELYQRLDKNYAGFENHLLLSGHEFSGDWDTWEMHPAGDEVVMLLSGAATMIYWRDGTEELIELREPGSYIVVPAGIWHTARVQASARMVFFTPGAGTQNAASPGQA